MSYLPAALIWFSFNWVELKSSFRVYSSARKKSPKSRCELCLKSNSTIWKTTKQTNQPFLFLPISPSAIIVPLKLTRKRHLLTIVFPIKLLCPIDFVWGAEFNSYSPSSLLFKSTTKETDKSQIRKNSVRMSSSAAVNSQHRMIYPSRSLLVMGTMLLVLLVQMEGVEAVAGKAKDLHYWYLPTESTIRTASEREVFTKPQCIKINDNLRPCTNLRYSSMRMPNLLAQSSLFEVKNFLMGFDDERFLECDPFARDFICSLATPLCFDGRAQFEIPPCRTLCERVRDNCFSLLLEYGLGISNRFNCSKFENNELCMDPSATAETTPSKTLSFYTDILNCNLLYSMNPNCQNAMK